MQIQLKQHRLLAVFVMPEHIALEQAALRKLTVVWVIFALQMQMVMVLLHHVQQVDIALEARIPQLPGVPKLLLMPQLEQLLLVPVLQLLLQPLDV